MTLKEASLENSITEFNHTRIAQNHSPNSMDNFAGPLVAKIGSL
jgi:hypothetical protein